MDDWDNDGQAQHELMLERQQMALDALMNCKRAGADLADLATIAVEMGLAREWKQYEATTQP